jgi:hypothetical protein
MAVFSDIELEWEDRIYTIRSNRVMKAIGIIEDHITLAELQVYSQRGAAPLGKLCMAFAAVLRYAGASVKDDDVYERAFSGEEAQAAMMRAILHLMRMMLPASARAKLEAATADPDGQEAAELTEAADSGNSQAAVQASSQKPTKRRSQKANG